MFRLRTNNGITWLQSSLLHQTGLVTHAFSTRLGGVSPIPWDSLNMGFSTKDDKANVIENRVRFVRRFDLKPEQMVSLSFIHSAKTIAVSAVDKGKGFLDSNTAPADADGMISVQEGMGLFITYSDCAPLLFFDPVRRVIAASHSGWRGTVAGMPSETVKQMQTLHGCEPSDILVAIGPTIGSEHYEVGDDVVEAFRTRYPMWRGLFHPNGSGKLNLNLPLAVQWQLEATGVSEANIDRCRLSTYERTDLFFSYRRSGRETFGIMGAFIMLNEFLS